MKQLICIGFGKYLNGVYVTFLLYEFSLHLCH